MHWRGGGFLCGLKWGAGARGEHRRKAFATVVATVVVASVVYALDIRFLLLGARGVTAVDDIGEAVAAAIASAACAWAATRAVGRDRLGWTLISISTGLWSAGEVVWAIYEVRMRVAVPYPSPPAAGFLAPVPFP